NVVSYDTIIEVLNPDLKLKPGMTANVSILVAKREGVLKMPNVALRFRPPSGAELTKGSVPPAAEEARQQSHGPADSTGPKKDKRKTGRPVYVLAKGSQAGESGRGGVLRQVFVKTGINDSK